MAPRSLIQRLSDAALADLLAPLRPPRTEPRAPSVIRLQRCEFCREYLAVGSREMGQCQACGTWFDAVRVTTPTITKE